MDAGNCSVAYEEAMVLASKVVYCEIEKSGAVLLFIIRLPLLESANSNIATMGLAVLEMLFLKSMKHTWFELKKLMLTFELFF